MTIRKSNPSLAHVMDSSCYPDFFHGKLDPKMVAEYLNLKDPQIPDYSAAKHKNPSSNKQLSPDEIVDVARKEYDVICRVLIDRRMSLANAMTRRTLDATASKLKILQPYDLINDELMTDPEKGPILLTLKRKLAPTASEVETDTKRRLEQELKTADGLTSLEIPELPCNLECALQFLVGDFQVKWDALELAYLEWLIIKTNPEADFYERYEDNLLKERLRDLTKVKKAFPSNKRLLASVKSCKKAMKEQEKIRQIRSNFSPGSVVNDACLDRRAKHQYKQRWSKQSIAHKELLELLESDFRRFWTTHSPEYLKIFPEYTKKKKATSKTKRSAGNSGIEARVHQMWLDRTSGLIEFLGNRELPKDPEKISKILDSFAQDFHGLKSPDPKETNRLFFQALIARLPNKPSDTLARTILSILRPGVQDLDELQNSRATKRRPRKRNTYLDPEIGKRVADDERRESKKVKSQLVKKRRLFKSMTREIILECYCKLEKYQRHRGLNRR